jgi:hypothetical protein
MAGNYVNHYLFMNNFLQGSETGSDEQDWEADEVPTKEERENQDRESS